MTNLQERIVSGVVLAGVAIGCILAGEPFTFTLLAVLCIACIYEVMRFFTMPKPLKIGAIVYILLGFAGAYTMYQNHGSFLFCIIASVIILTDIGAYFAGKIIGGPKIAPGISPNKTWAGSLGGMLLPLFLLGLFVVVDNGYFLSGNNLTLLIVVFAMISLSAETGDLFESWLKRKAGIKDSSNLIPGHGGFFDRLDSWISAFLVAAAIDVFNQLAG